MLKNYKFWWKAGAWALLVTALLHSLSLINKPVGENDTERQLLDLMMNYKLGGVNRTMYELYFFFSLSLTMFTVFSAALNFMFIRFYMPSVHERKFMTISIIFWTILLIPLAMYTFIIPLGCYTICWLFFLAGYLVWKPGTDA